MAARKFLLIQTYLTLIFIQAVYPDAAGFGTEKQWRISAEKYAEAAVAHFAAGRYSDAFFSAKTGLSYSDDISDLWYVKSAAGAFTGIPKARQRIFLEKAFALDSWVNNIEENAKLFYADLLSEICLEQQALEVLAEISGADTAEILFIKIKSLYRIHDISAARKFTAEAVKRFPEDSRFRKIFFAYENPDAVNMSADGDEEFASLAEKILADISVFAQTDPECILAAVPFSDNGRILLDMYAENTEPRQRSIYYPLEAYRTGLADAMTAAGLFADCAASYGTIPFRALENLLHAYSGSGEDEAVSAIEDFLLNFSGSIWFDTNGSGLKNLNAEYAAGKLTAVSYSRLQDDVDTWKLICADGMPQAIELAGGADMRYGVFPAVRSCFFRDIDTAAFFFPDTVFWTPVLFSSPDFLPDSAFQIPRLPADAAAFPRENFWQVVSELDQPVSGTKQCRNTMSFSDAVPLYAEFSENGKIYAKMQYEAGLPSVCSVDADKDGFFELNERYAFDPEFRYSPHDANEKSALYARIFGIFPAKDGIYCRKISGDLNRDSKTDYEIEYHSGGICVQRWDSAYSGVFDCGCETMPSAAADASEYISVWFTNHVTGKKVSVHFRGGHPFSVETDGVSLPVIKEPSADIYWIGSACSSKAAETVLREINRADASGVYIDIEESSEPKKIYAVKFDRFCFAEIFDMEKTDYDL
ncbi:MAG: hypothetical protein NC041_08155 [Bacteroides sp.]|nr:hypothetical protein [Prevotella sp.]MCM1408344.1 hypothetical protein [Treponema brennaborense]MCM1470424.1 hypothetical protein [Bacteroides sp.]